MATVFVVQYSSFGGKNKGGDDDTIGFLPQIPGRITKIDEFDASTPKQITFEDDTSFFKLQAFGGDVWHNYNTNDTGGDSLVAGDRDRSADGALTFQGITSNKTGKKFYTQLNVKDVV